MIDNSAHFFSPKTLWSFTLLLFTALFLNGCGAWPITPVYEPSSRTSYPKPNSPKVRTSLTSPKSSMLTGPAAPLHRKAQTLLSKKEYRQAELAMERALRVEPKNGYYWHTLAEIAFSQNQHGRTVQLCLKSKSLASGDARLIQLNDQLIQKSR